MIGLKCVSQISLMIFLGEQRAHLESDAGTNNFVHYSICATSVNFIGPEKYKLMR